MQQHHPLKILLLGKNGQLGFELSRALSLLGDVQGFDSKTCNLEDPEALRQCVRHYAPDVIVNAAAYTAVDQAEKEMNRATAVNAVAPLILAQEAEHLKAMLVHFSTDYVFDGQKKEPYCETDAVNPQSVYGRSKYEGECAIARTCLKHLILRTAWVVGAHGNNFAKTILRLASEKQSLRVVNDQWGAPTSAALLADLTAHLIRQAFVSSDDFSYGLYHASASGQTHWHEYATYIVEQAHLKGRALTLLPQSIAAVTSLEYPTLACRPSYSVLSNDKLSQTFGFYFPHWKKSLDLILDQLL